MKKIIENFNDHIWSFIGSFIGISLIGATNLYLGKLEPMDNLFLIGSFGATAVLVYGEIKSPLAQPRNVILGHVVSAIIGVSFAKIFSAPDLIWIGAAFSVSIAIVAMQILDATHPPGGATAMIASIGSEKIKSMGYMYVVAPVFTGVMLLMLVALVINNISKDRRYPFKKI